MAVYEAPMGFVEEAQPHLKQLLNRIRPLIPNASPMGAYALGVLTAHAIETQIWPTQGEILAALESRDLTEVAVLMDIRNRRL